MVNTVGMVYLVWLFRGILLTRLFLEQGTMLKSQGKVYVNTNDRFFSIFHKIAIPHFTLRDVPRDCYDPNSNRVQYEMLSCTVPSETTEGYWAIHSCPSDKLKISVDARKNVISIVQEHIARFDALSSIKGDGKSKRGILGVLGVGGGLLSMLFSGFSTARLAAHITKVESEFRNFIGTEVDNLDRLGKVVNNNFRVIDGRLSRLDQALMASNIEKQWELCSERVSFSKIHINEYINKWQSLIQGYFIHVNDGSLGGKMNIHI